MSATPPTVQTETSLRARMDGYAEDRQRTALVPTMGALHEGHLSLIRIAKRVADKVIVSIFVNPTQFAPGEDFEAYPRSIADDLDMLGAEGVDLVYLPERADMYAQNHSTSVIVAGVGEGLETNHRPTFFHGVALVVTKLLNRVRPDIAIFGEKDYQQLAVIRRLTRDLDIPTEIIGGPIARDAHGLALSSRNRYFDDNGLSVARGFNAIMKTAIAALAEGRDLAKTLESAEKALLDLGFTSVDYIALADAETLEPVETLQAERSYRLLAAGHCPRNGQTGETVRLIDNFPVSIDGGP